MIRVLFKSGDFDENKNFQWRRCAKVFAKIEMKWPRPYESCNYGENGD